MGEPEATRLIAWGSQLRAVHERLRAALEVVWAALDAGSDPAEPASDLRLYCGGFCTALSGHHAGEDATLFPALAAAHPELAPVLQQLRRDHRMLEDLLGGLRRAVAAGAGRVEIEQHLDGVSALLESHFGYEERQLLGVLATLELSADPLDVLGPLATDPPTGAR